MISPLRKQTEKTVARTLEKIGPSAVVNRFLSKYGNIRTKAIYAVQLHFLFQWLRQQKNITTNTIRPSARKNEKCTSQAKYGQYHIAPP
jgi:hypothetical protein